MNIHNEQFNGVRQLRWQHLTPVVSTFSTDLHAFILLFHKTLHRPSLFLSLSHPVFIISGISLLFGDVDVFFLQSKVFLQTHSLSRDHFYTDAVVPSSDHCRTETVLSPSDHYGIETVAPSADHSCIDIKVTSSEYSLIEKELQAYIVLFQLFVNEMENK